MRQSLDWCLYRVRNGYKKRRTAWYGSWDDGYKPTHQELWCMLYQSGVAREQIEQLHNGKEIEVSNGSIYVLKQELTTTYTIQ